LERVACEEIDSQLDDGAPLFVSDDYEMYDLVSLLRNCSRLVTSRFHAIVTSMPGLVVSSGITIDERIRNVMASRGHQHLFFEAGDPDIEERTFKLLRDMDKEADKIREDIARTIPGQLELMGQMGIDFADEVSRVYPSFPRRDLPRTWQAHLPSLPEALNPIMERYA
jgi:polysaccharide pyruvyl transferase WcaK-like protein